ncbi:MAG: AMP-binding protein [Deltaproteobacteria bacterium]|nr:AMP-binding protein [Deltaproteobacteria bacterium]MBW2417838.1 AMP-binding protein [Deltaproteobacteria bacterium]
MNVASLVLERARSEPDAPAIFFPAGRRDGDRVRYEHVTNGQLDAESDWIARGLEEVGIGRGVRTALMVRPGLDLFALTLALFKLGAIPVIVDPGLGLARLRSCLAEAEPEAFIGIPSAQAARIAFRWARATLRVAVTVGRRWLWGGPTLAELRERGRSDEPYPLAETRDEDEAAILFTSGSTGPPKGVVYRHGNFAAQIEAIRGLGTLEKGEVDLPTFPLFALFDPALGMTAVVPEMDPTRPGDVDPRRIIEAAEEFGATNLFGSPALLDTVGRYGAEHGVRLSSLRRVISAGAPVPAEVMERFLRMLPEGAEVLTPYGATECLPVACISSREVLAETGARSEQGAGVCVGAPVPSIELRIIVVRDEPIATWHASLEQPRGEVGEIVVRGPQVTEGYYKRPEANALAKIADRDGGLWHRMGDLGYLDTQGRLWYCGRKSDRVMTAQGTLYTIPCEAVFDTHPRVRRTALVGIGGAGAQESVLCVELPVSEKAANRAEVTGELLEIGARHAHTRSIRRVLFHPRFPVDIRHNAKIGRPELTRWAAGQLAARGKAAR